MTPRIRLFSQTVSGVPPRLKSCHTCLVQVGWNPTAHRLLYILLNGFSPFADLSPVGQIHAAHTGLSSKFNEFRSCRFGWYLPADGQLQRGLCPSGVSSAGW